MTSAYRPLAVGATAQSALPASDARGRIDTNYQLFGNVSITKGKHSYKMGYEWRRTFINSFIDSGHRGKLVFATIGDFLCGQHIDGGSSADGDGTRYSYQNTRRLLPGFLARDNGSRSTTGFAGITSASSAQRTTRSACSTRDTASWEQVGVGVGLVAISEATGRTSHRASA